jgi:hypothetical protein
LPSLTKVWDFFLYCPLPPRHFEPFSKYHPSGHELYNRKQKESITGKIPPRPSCCWDIEGSETRELQDVYFIRAFQDGNYVELFRLSAPSEESSNKLSIRTTTYSPVDKTYELISPEEWLKEICIHLTGYSRENQRKTEAHQEIHVTEGWQPPNQGLELTKNVSTGLCHIKLLGGQRGHELSDLFRDAAVFISRHFNRAMVHGTFLMPR